jgi:hypothetical protein
VDGTAGSYRPLAEAVNVVDRGHGLRTRLIVEAPATVRFLRIGDANGDGAFSISEFAAYCWGPSSPPRLRIAGENRPAPPAPAEPVQQPKKSTIGGLQVALGLVILVLAVAASGRSRKGGDRPQLEESRSRPERLFPLVLLLFVGSGCAALIYEIVWFQMLQLVLGSSAFSIGVLLGTFMGGMCIGSLALARYVPRSRHPLRVYALLEAAIAACGLLMLLAMPLVQSVYTSVVGLGVPGLVLRALFAGICLLPPTVMMGATLPAVARWVETTPRGVSWLGSSTQTVGAVLGCLLPVSISCVLTCHRHVVAVCLTARGGGRYPGVTNLVPSPPDARRIESPGASPRREDRLRHDRSGMSALGAR